MTMFDIGAAVQVRNGDLSGDIIECRGGLGPEGQQVYRLRLHGRSGDCIELLESQLFLLDEDSADERRGISEWVILVDGKVISSVKLKDRLSFIRIVNSTRAKSKAVDGAIGRRTVRTIEIHPLAGVIDFVTK